MSVVCVTKRQFPYIEWSLKCLGEQTYPHSDFEYIIVDGLWHRRKGEYERIAKEMGVDFKVLHIPDKPNRWNGQRPAIANARNTGLIFADKESKYILHHDDCCKFGNDWIQRHVNWLESGYFCAGSWVGYKGIDSNGKGIIGDLGLEYRAAHVMRPCIMSATWFYCQNSSYPLEWALDINAFDEMYDGEMGQEDISLGIRLERNGHQMIFDPTNNTEVYVASHYYEKLIPPVNRILKDEREHFSNEWITERLLDDKDRVMPYGNIIDIRTARNIMKNCNLSIDEMYKLMERWEDPDIRDWRDGELIKEKLDKER